MSRKSLNIFPSDPHVMFPPPQALAERLRGVGLIGEPVPDEFETQFATGPRFETLITFHASHSVVELVGDGAGGLRELPPRDSRNFCVIVPQYSDDRRPNAIVSSITETARCPCGFIPPEPLDVIKVWYDADRRGRWGCPVCGKQYFPWELDWRHAAGFATDYIEIVGVRPGEATPSAALGADLFDVFGGSIAYSYSWL